MNFLLNHIAKAIQKDAIVGWESNINVQPMEMTTEEITIKINRTLVDDQDTPTQAELDRDTVTTQHPIPPSMDGAAPNRHDPLDMTTAPPPNAVRQSAWSVGDVITEQAVASRGHPPQGCTVIEQRNVSNQPYNVITEMLSSPPRQHWVVGDHITVDHIRDRGLVPTGYTSRQEPGQPYRTITSLPNQHHRNQPNYVAPVQDDRVTNIYGSWGVGSIISDEMAARGITPARIERSGVGNGVREGADVGRTEARIARHRRDMGRTTSSNATTT